jgi:hypothetical protein
MARFKYDWPEGEYVVFFNRHLPRELHTQMKREAARRGISLELLCNMAVEEGLRKLERKTNVKPYRRQQ